MGCDIHPYFEILVDGDWQPIWQPKLHPDYWWESLCESKAEGSEGDILYPDLDTDQRMKKFQDYFEKMSREKASETFLHHTDAYRVWFEHYNYRADYRSFSIKERNYGFFGELASVRTLKVNKPWGE